jgi:hypothetical protein
VVGNELWSSSTGEYYAAIGFQVLTVVVMKLPSFGIQRSLLATCFHTGFLLDLLFDREDGGDMFLRNVGLIPTDYTALYPRR